LAGEWPQVRLADVCDSIDYGYTASAADQPVGPRFLRITDIVSGGIDWNTVPHCEIDRSAKTKFKLDHGDIVIARTGATTGVSAWIRNPPDAVFASYLVRLKVGKTADSRFVSYFLKSEVFWSYIRGVLGDKSAQPNASAKTMTQVHFALPPLEEQRAIAAILGALDDRIELNRRMNKTLEAIARALFKSWFVDFDPVRAKMRGEKPWGMDAATAALFPDRLVETEIVEVPEGWKVGKLGDLADNPRRGVQPAEIAAGTPYIALEHMPSKSIALGDWAVADSVASNKFRFETGEILFGKLRPYFHKVGVAPVDGVCTTDILVVRPKTTEAFGYVLAVASSDELVAQATARSTGTKMPRTNWQDIAAFPLAIPPVQLLSAFDGLVRASVNRIRVNLMESRTLAALRDALLPKLLSGEVRTTPEVWHEAL
jgi:type I restriction enzyme, S subunit